MSWFARTLLIIFLAAILIAGLAAIAMLWEQDDEVSDESPLAGMEKFTARADGVAAPAITFVDGEGSRVALADFHGEVVLLNFWATWCAPCVRELPSLDRLQKKLKDKGVKIVALSLDRNPEAVRDFFADNGIHNLDIYIDTTMEAQRVFQIPGLPTTVLIDREGHDRGRLIGPADWSGKDAAKLVLSADEEEER
jgi:thiol-disulfide isomerase/thioredoxin